jgi:hypothetical protein
LASFFITFLSPGIATSISKRAFFIIPDYDIWFIVGPGSVGLNFLIP